MSVPAQRSAPEGTPGGHEVFVTVGSDHHPFDRIVGWVDAWLDARRTLGLEVPRVLVQHGPAAAPRLADGVAFLPHDALLAAMTAARVVVTQGGPASVAEARDRGRLPIVVPRLSARGEVVDDHQVAYTRLVGERGDLVAAETEADLHAHLDRALAAPEAFEVSEDPGRLARLAEATARFARVVDEVVAARSGPAPQVVLLGGLGRSGSTLVERALGQVPGVTALGEVVHLWERGVGEDQLCGCGEPFSRCPFWQDVGKRAFGGWDSLDPEEVLADRYEAVRNRFVPGLVATPWTTRRRLRTHRLRRRLTALYRAAGAGGDLLVDSSKHPAYAFLLRRCRVRLTCVLVVRDPRGTAWSWQKQVLRPEIVGTDEEMPRYGVVGSALRWDAYALLVLALRAFGIPVLVLRYEDFVADPAGSLSRVLRHAGRDDRDAAHHVGPDGLTLDVHHTVAGNPMRFRTGQVPLRADQEWRTAMPVGDRRTVGVLTAPVRALLGYRGSGLDLPRAPRGRVRFRDRVR